MRAPVLLPLVLGSLLACPACWGGDDPPATPDAAPLGPPVVVSFAVNPATLVEDATVTLAAEIEDPDGVEDLVAVVVHCTSSGVLYGALVETARTSPTRATFSLNLAWDDVHALEPIEFYDGGTFRDLEVEASDRAGNTDRASAYLNLDCNGDDACGGACVDTWSDEAHCGTCDEVCTGTAHCARGNCHDPTPTECLDVLAISDTWTCAQECASRGTACVEACGANDSGLVGYVTVGDCADGTVRNEFSCTTPVRQVLQVGDYCESARCCCE